MFDSVLSVASRVLILFIMIAVGYVLSKTGSITKRGAQQINFILFYVVTPTLIISSLQGMIGRVSLTNLLMAGGLAVVCMLIGIVISKFFFRNSIYERKKVLRFACVYSNCAYMGIPLAQGVAGDSGVAYASMFIVVFNLFVWTHGYACMSNMHGFSWKKIVTNPGLIGIVIGLPLFAFSIRLPEVLNSPMGSFASLNTPLAMIVVGCYIARVSIKELFEDTSLYLMSVVRLVLIPLVSFAVLYLLHVDKTIATTVLILCAAPPAATTAMFAAQFGGDAKLASKSVAIATLFSMITMPVFILLAKLF